jgi:hypothetical protein
MLLVFGKLGFRGRHQLHIFRSPDTGQSVCEAPGSWVNVAGHASQVVASTGGGRQQGSGNCLHPFC